MEKPSGQVGEERGSVAPQSGEKGMVFLKMVKGLLLASLKGELEKGKGRDSAQDAKEVPGQMGLLSILRKIFAAKSSSGEVVQTGSSSSPDYREVGDKGRRVALIAEEYANNRKDILGLHCWDWVDKVYKAAGVKMKTIYQDIKYEGKDCGSHHAGPSLINQLEPGDWIYANNKNKSDTHGNHSLIFLGWQDRAAGVAKVASCPGYKKPGRVHTINIVRCPIVHISKPG